MNAEELVRAGRLTEALSALQSDIRQNPGNPKLRIFLFQLNCLLGQWDKALNQLQVVASLNAETMLMAQIFRPVIACELLRREVFAGKRTPLIFGEPEEWVGLYVQAAGLVARGEYAPAAALRERAIEAAPASEGRLDGKAFEWIADADSRLGPILEVILEGKYYWAPFHRVRSLELQKPSDLRDLVWAPARLTWSNGGTVSVHVPVRYPGTESAEDDALRLSRKTVWQEQPEGWFLGSGQRLFCTNEDERPLLECQLVEINPTD